MTDFTIAEVPVPPTLDAGGDGADDFAADDFAAVLEVRNLVYAIGFGTDDLSERPSEALPHFQNKERPQRILAARVDNRVVGVGFYETTLGEDADSGWLSVAVLDAFEIAVSVLPSPRGSRSGRLPTVRQKPSATPPSRMAVANRCCPRRALGRSR